MNPPEAKWVNEEWFSQHGYANLAAMFSRPSQGSKGTIFFNEDHPRFVNLVGSVVKKLGGSYPVELCRSIARKHMKSACYAWVGTHVVSGLQLLTAGHNEQEVMSSLSPVALTTALSTTLKSQWFDSSVKSSKHSMAREMAAIREEAA